MKKIFIIGIIGIILFSGCGSFGNQVTKFGKGASRGDYVVTLYSGGQVVRTWEVQNGFVNTESGSDGWFFNYNGKLVRVAGTVSVEEK